MTDREFVLSRHPQATLREDPDPLDYSRWLVVYDPGLPYFVGGDPTEDEAWRNAAVHTRELIAFEARVPARATGDRAMATTEDQPC